MVKIEFKTDNAAFGEDDADLHEACGNILRGVSQRIRFGERAGTIRDANGNTIGSFSVESSK